MTTKFGLFKQYGSYYNKGQRELVCVFPSMQEAEERKNKEVCCEARFVEELGLLGKYNFWIEPIEERS